MSDNAPRPPQSITANVYLAAVIGSVCTLAIEFLADMFRLPLLLLAVALLSMLSRVRPSA